MSEVTKTDDLQQEVDQKIKETMKPEMDAQNEKVEGVKSKVDSLEQNLNKLVEISTKSQEALTEVIKSNEEAKKFQGKKGRKIDLSGDIDLSCNDKHEYAFHGEKSLKISDELIHGKKTFVVHDFKYNNNKLLLNKQKSSTIYNTFNDAYGGISMNYPSHLGLVNDNVQVYAPFAAFCGSAQVGLAGGTYDFYDPANIRKLNKLRSKELTKAEKLDLLKQKQIVLNQNEYSSVHYISTRQWAAIQTGETKYDLRQMHEEVLDETLAEILNDEIAEMLLTKQEGIATYTTAITNTFNFSDIFNLQRRLKPVYLSNLALIVNDTTLTYLTNLVGSNGHYIWKDMFRNQASGEILSATLNTPLGDVKIVGIHEEADKKFQDFDFTPVEGDNPTVGTNTGKTIGVLADWDKFIKIAYNGYVNYSILDDELQTLQAYKFYKGIFRGFDYVTKEAGTLIKVK